MRRWLAVTLAVAVVGVGSLAASADLLPRDRQLHSAAAGAIRTVATVLGEAALRAADRAADEAAKQARLQLTLAHQRERTAALTAELAAYDRSSPVDFAVAAVDNGTGASYSYQGKQRFETASVVKVDIAVALSLQAKRAGRALNAQERALLSTMIRNSDNAAASTLWQKVGGGAGLAAAATQLGLTATTPGSNGLWGLTTTTADDQTRLLRRLADPAGPVPADSASYLLSLMSSVASDQAWGVSAATTGTEQVALKNGWLPRTSLGGRWIVNSIGRITGPNTDLTLVVLSRGATTMDAGVAAVEKVASMTRGGLTGK